VEVGEIVDEAVGVEVGVVVEVSEIVGEAVGVEVGVVVDSPQLVTKNPVKIMNIRQTPDTNDSVLFFFTIVITSP
jgi:hypothetical protein